MGIQVWFIVLGVGVMTLIVWDGKRRKLKQRSSSAAGITQKKQAVELRPSPINPLNRSHHPKQMPLLCRLPT